MRVQAMAVWHVRIGLKKPIRHASHTRTETDNVVVGVTLEDGTQGFGEGVPRDYVTGETVDSALALLRRADLRAQLTDCSDFASAVQMAERLALPPVPDDRRDCQGNAARCAVELALLDAYGRAFGRPLSDATALLAPELHEPRPMVRYSGVITSSDGWKLRMAAWKMWVFGFRQLKVKVGIAGQDDARRLRAVRRRVGAGMDLRIDANEAWSAAQLPAHLEQLRAVNISSVEQPLPHEEVEALAQLRPNLGVPVMFDESLCSMADARRAVDQRLCDLFNLRLSKCGGFIRSLRLAQFARQHGIGCQLGCQVGESALLSAAGRHFACSVSGLRYLEGSYDRHLVREALATTDVTFRWGGQAPALAGGGLGVTVDPQQLARAAARREVLFA